MAVLTCNYAAVVVQPVLMPARPARMANVSGQEGLNKRPPMVCVKAQSPLFFLLSSDFLISIDLTLFRVVTILDP